MAYTPKEWQCGDAITADDLNRMEEGIQIFMQSSAFGIISTDIANWDNAFHGKIQLFTTEESGDDYNLTQILTTYGWLYEVIDYV